MLNKNTKVEDKNHSQINNVQHGNLIDFGRAITTVQLAGAEAQLKEAHKIMGMVNTLSPLMEQAFNQWTKITITDIEVQKLIQIALAPNRETLDNIRDGKLEVMSGNYRNQVYGVRFPFPQIPSQPVRSPCREEL